MRMRKKKNMEPRTEKCAAINILEPENLKGKWREYFGNNNEIYLEIGCGKGRFIRETALENKDVNFVAIERDPSVLLMAMEQAMAENIENLRFINYDAADLANIFEDGEVGRVFLNFSDPWPPRNRAKRRLTHHLFLETYRKVLKQDGEIHMKTDNSKLFEFSLNEFADFGAKLSQITFDLHKTDTPNIMTEYEQRFSEQGMQIYRCVAKMQNLAPVERFVIGKIY